MVKVMKQSLAIATVLCLIVIFLPLVYAQEYSETQQSTEQEKVSDEQVESQVEKPQSTEATSKQKRQVRNCIRVAHRVRMCCHRIEKMVYKKSLPQAAFSEIVNEAVRETQMMQDQNEKFVGSLSEDQKAQMKDRIKKMDQIDEKITSHLEKIDKELSKPTFQRTSIALITEDIELDMEDWQRIYRGIAVDMDVSLTAR